MKNKCLTLVILVFLSSGCVRMIQSGKDDSNAALSSSSVNLADPVAVKNQAMQILANNCTGCHGASTGPAGIFNLLDTNHLLSSGLIIAGQPDNSLLIQSIEAKRMPPSGPLNAADQQVLRAWIAGGAQAPTIVPVVTPNPPAAPTPLTGTLEQNAVTILQTTCYSCHGTIASGGISQINDPAHLISAGLITPGNATTSTIYDAIVKGRMPPGKMLNSADINVIKDWINAGATSPAVGSMPPPPPPIPLAANFKSLDANVFQPKCVACHSATLAKDGVRIDTYTNVLKYVVKGNASQSKIYKISRDGEMPPRPNPVLTSEELMYLSQWINSGATNN